MCDCDICRMKISAKTLQPAHFVFVPLKGVEHLPAAIRQMQAWAKKSQPVSPEKYVLMYLDSFRNTAPAQVRMRFGIFLPEKTEDLPANVESVFLEKMRVLTAQVLLKSDEFSNAWKQMHACRLSQNLSLGEGFPFEIHHKDPEKHPEKLHEVTLVLPIQE